jgi:UDP-N-acetylmuramate--alanine ligase
MDEFSTAFRDADSLTVLDIYAASEQPIEGISGEALAAKISSQGGQSARYASSFADAVEGISALAQERDMILTLGAGSVSQLGPMILEKLRAQEPAAHSV